MVVRTNLIREVRMRVVAINGSPRKTWNTATLLRKAVDGAKQAGAETTLYHLSDLAFSGCISCLACKRVGALPVCQILDELSPLLADIATADALICGTPVYFYGETGLFRNFMERLLFPYNSYESQTSLFPRHMPVGLIYTMNLPEKIALEPRDGYPLDFVLHTHITTSAYFKKVFGSCEYLFACDTLQVEDYSRYAMARFDQVAKRNSRQYRFPEDCHAAFSLGQRLVAATGERQS